MTYDNGLCNLNVPNLLTEIGCWVGIIFMLLPWAIIKAKYLTSRCCFFEMGEPVITILPEIGGAGGTNVVAASSIPAHAGYVGRSLNNLGIVVAFSPVIIMPAAVV